MPKEKRLFLEPRIKKCDSLEDLLTSSEDFGYFSRFGGAISDMLLSSKIFLVSEPGYGKSEVLKEIVFRSVGAGNSAKYIDLKVLNGASLLSQIKTKDATITENQTTPLEQKGVFQTIDFEMKDSTAVTVCLDALDEVKQEHFSEVVDQIKNLMQQFPNAQIILSCRKSYLLKWRHLFADQSFIYHQLLCFDYKLIRKFLLKNGLSEANFKHIFETLHFESRFPISRVPRYLKMILEFINSKGVDALSDLTRSKLFGFFVDSHLAIEEKKVGKVNKREMAKKVLSKLALVMEIYQANLISKDELLEFLDNVRSNLNIAFLLDNRIDFLYERSLLKENPDTIEFVNAEFQEYLASREILNLGNVDQVVFDLMIVEELGEIHPSWISTLSFLLEEDVSLLPSLIKYTTQKSGLESHFSILPTNNLSRLTTQELESIFRHVLQTYERNGHWLNYDVAEKLSFYYQKEFHTVLNAAFKLKTEDPAREEINKANTILLSSYLFKRGLLSSPQVTLWKKRAVEAILTPYTNEVVPRFALSALGNFGDKKTLSRELIEQVYATGEDTIISNLVYAFEQIGLNTELAALCLTKGIAINNVSARHILTEVLEKEAISYIVTQLSTDIKLLNEFLDHESIYKGDTEVILKNIEAVLDAKLLQSLKELFYNCFDVESWYDAERSPFVVQLAKLIDRHSPGFLFDLIEKYRGTNYLHALSNVFIALVTLEDFDRFIAELKDHEWIVFPIVRGIILSDNKDAKKIEVKAKKIFYKQFKTLRSQERQAHVHDQARNRKTYNDFKLKLEPAEKRYIPDVFSHYLNNHKVLEGLVTPQEKERLANLATEEIIGRFNPGKQKLKYIKKTEDSSTYSTNQYIHVFGDALRLAKFLDLDITKHRQHLINYIPFAYSEHIEAILHLVNKPTEKEVGELLKIYKNRRDDLRRFMPISFIEFAQTHKLTQSVPILKSFVKSKDLSDHDRSKAFDAVIELLSDPKKYAREIFVKCEKDDKCVRLRNSANAFLIQRHLDGSAIKWRMNKVIEGAQPFKEIRHAHGVSDIEHELRDKEFAKPLLILKGAEHRELFVKLLEHALEVYEKGDDFHEYADYLWSIGVSYFNNLKQTRSYGPLKEIESYIEKNFDRQGINWFIYKFQSLKKDYLVFIGKPENIAECIKKYNVLREKLYVKVISERDLYDAVKSALDVDVRNWVESEGAYKQIRTYRKAEDLIQKMIGDQIRLALIDRGFRKTDIYREPQLLDDKRTDILVKYGFIGPVLIEIKLSDNPEIINSKKRKLYKSKLLQYLYGTRSFKGIYLVFRTEEIHLQYVTLLKRLYEGEGVEVIDLLCAERKTNST